MSERTKPRKSLVSEAKWTGRYILLWPVIKDVFFCLGRLRAADVVDQIEEFLPPNSRILDVGCGLGFVSDELARRGHEIIGVDIVDALTVEAYKFVKASAYELPFESKCFDICLLHTALHHMEAPDRALQEAYRVSSCTIVGEELRVRGRNWFFLRNYDALVNLEFRGSPHSNKTDEQWMDAFAKAGFSVSARRKTLVFGFIHQVIYVLSALE